MKKGFGLINAIIVLLLISALMTAVVKMAFVSVKHTSDTYMQQRAELFMQSALENSLLAVEGYERNGTCLENIVFNDEDGRFEANVSILRYYCYDLNDCNCSNNPSLVKKISTPVSHGYVLLKIVVESNVSNPKNNNKKIKLKKITLQRP
ncbi:hypothetical protein [Nautilia sp.]